MPVLQGLWQRGKASGPGRYKWKNGNEYDGEWQNGRMHGQGTLKWQSGTKSRSALAWAIMDASRVETPCMSILQLGVLSKHVGRRSSAQGHEVTHEAGCTLQPEPLLGLSVQMHLWFGTLNMQEACEAAARHLVFGL